MLVREVHDTKENGGKYTRRSYLFNEVDCCNCVRIGGCGEGCGLIHCVWL